MDTSLATKADFIELIRLQGETVKQDDIQEMDWLIKVGPETGTIMPILIGGCVSGAAFILRRDTGEMDTATAMWAKYDPQGTQDLKDDLGIR